MTLSSGARCAAPLLRSVVVVPAAVRTRACVSLVRGLHGHIRVRAPGGGGVGQRRGVTVWAFRGGATAVGILGAYVGLLVVARMRFMQRIYLLRSLRASRQKTLTASSAGMHLHRPDKLKW
jgi:hypothetical protein